VILLIKCSCGNDEFKAHIGLTGDIIVNGQNNWIGQCGGHTDNNSIYGSSKPFGPYICTVCKKEYDDLEELMERSRCQFCGRFVVKGEDTCPMCLFLNMDICIMCGGKFSIGNTGNELGFCIDCQKSPDFPYDLKKYYEDHDAGLVGFKGFDTMERGILEDYRR